MKKCIECGRNLPESRFRAYVNSLGILQIYVTHHWNTQHQKMKGVRHSMRTKNMKITEMIWKTGYLYSKVHSVGYWAYWRIKKAGLIISLLLYIEFTNILSRDSNPGLTLRKSVALSTELLSHCKYTTLK